MPSRLTTDDIEAFYQYLCTHSEVARRFYLRYIKHYLNASIARESWTKGHKGLLLTALEHAKPETDENLKSLYDQIKADIESEGQGLPDITQEETDELLIQLNDFQVANTASSAPANNAPTRIKTGTSLFEKRQINFPIRTAYVQKIENNAIPEDLLAMNMFNKNINELHAHERTMLYKQQANMQNQMGILEHHQRKYDSAIQHFNRAIAIIKQLIDESPNDSLVPSLTLYTRNLAATYHQLMINCHAQHAFINGIKLGTHAVLLLKGISPRPQQEVFQSQLRLYEQNLLFLLNLTMGLPQVEMMQEDVISVYQRAFRLIKKDLTENNLGFAKYFDDIVNLLLKKAHAYLETQEYTEAIKYFRSVLHQIDKLPTTYYTEEMKRVLISALVDMGKTEHVLGIQAMMIRDFDKGLFYLSRAVKRLQLAKHVLSDTNISLTTDSSILAQVNYYQYQYILAFVTLKTDYVNNEEFRAKQNLSLILQALTYAKRKLTLQFNDPLQGNYLLNFQMIFVFFLQQHAVECFNKGDYQSAKFALEEAIGEMQVVPKTFRQVQFKQQMQSLKVDLKTTLQQLSETPHNSPAKPKR